MPLRCFGRITAQAAIVCAAFGVLLLAMVNHARAAFATDTTVSNLTTPQAASPAASDLLLISAATPQSVDVQWALRDQRQILPDGAVQNGVLMGAASNSAPPSITPPNISQLPHVDVPPEAQESATDINDKLVPLPVVHVGWAILLCALLFNVGARVLRMGRRVRAS